MPRPRFSLLSLLLFSLLCGSGMMLYYHYPVWRLIVKTEPRVMRHEFDSEGIHLLTLTYDQGATLRTVEGETLWHKPQCHAHITGKIVEVMDSKSNKSLYWHLNQRKWVSGDLEMVAESEEESFFSPSGSGLEEYVEFYEVPNHPNLTLAKTNQLNGDEYLNDLHLLKKLRPEPWYGLVWLPAFWTTLLLAALFVWNLFRSSKPKQQKSPAL